jgi:DNA topoisomerase-1
MEAYCVKCKTKREMAEAEAVFTASGTPATRGRCPECGTTLYRMGATEAHAGLPRPEMVARP